MVDAATIGLQGGWIKKAGLDHRPANDRRQAEFASVLSRSRIQNQSVAERARDGAEQFVSIALVQPLLKQLRESNTAAPPFAPTGAEKQFQSMFDAQIAQGLTRASRFGLVDRIAADLVKHARRSEATQTGADPEPRTVQGESR
jgi:Rod binding domain-containing protein